MQKFNQQNAKKNNSHIAFTLAEVLITLAIIGVVAAMTIPSLIQKYKDQAAVSQLKKVYSVLTQAWELMTLEYGPVSEWNLTANTGQEDMLMERLSKYLKFNKICKTTDPQTCLPKVTYLAIDDTQFADSFNISPAAAQMADGTLIRVNVRGSETQDQPIAFVVDLNGKDKPNKVGDDFFYFYVWITDNRVHPGGWQSLVPNKQGSFEWGCLKYGYNCANWVIEKGNRDYLRCKDLSYDGKSKCD